MKTGSASQRRQRRPSRVNPRSRIPLNEMVVQTSWTKGSLSSGTTGSVNSWTSPSIISSSEYSVYQALFTEVKLVSCKMIFTPTQATNGSVLHNTLVVATNMLENETTAVTPTGFGDVTNGTRPVRIASVSVRPFTYSMPVPPGLEFANLVADAPSPATPWAGSPGVVKWFGTGFTASTVYWTCHVVCVFHLRGRQ